MQETGKRRTETYVGDQYIRILTALPPSESGGIISRDADACELMHVTSFSHLLFRAVHARKRSYPGIPLRREINLQPPDTRRLPSRVSAAIAAKEVPDTRSIAAKEARRRVRIASFAEP